MSDLENQVKQTSLTFQFGVFKIFGTNKEKDFLYPFQNFVDKLNYMYNRVHNRN